MLNSTLIFKDFYRKLIYKNYEKNDTYQAYVHAPQNQLAEKSVGQIFAELDMPMPNRVPEFLIPDQELLVTALQKRYSKGLILKGKNAYKNGR